MNELFTNKRSFDFVTSPGSPIKEVYHGKILESGEIDLVLDGYENIQEYIDSFEEETNIHNIITRVNNGEIDLLNQRNGAYIDSVGFPKTYAEVLQKVIDGQRIFDMLPADIKAKFDNDFNKWFAQMGEPDFMVKSGFYKEIEDSSIDDNKDEEVKE